jgi:hypothetical protein
LALAALFAAWWGTTDSSSRQALARATKEFEPHDVAQAPAPPPDADAVVAGQAIAELGGPYLAAYGLRQRSAGYARSQAERASPDVVAPSADELEAIMTERPGIMRVRDHLIAHEVALPVEAIESCKYMHDLGVVELLAGDAMARCAAGDEAEAEKDLLAAWRLADAFTWRSSNSSVVTGNVQATLVAQLVRKLEHPSPDWLARLDDVERRRERVLAVARDGTRWHLDRARHPASKAALTDAERVVAVHGLSRRALASAIRRHHALQARMSIPILELLEAAGRCGGELPQVVQHAEAIAPEEPGTLGRPSPPANFVAHLDSLRLEFALTRRVLEWRRLRDASSDGRWPEDYAPQPPSDCPHVRFEVTRGGDLLVLEAVAPDGNWWETQPGNLKFALRFEVLQEQAP